MIQPSNEFLCMGLHIFKYTLSTPSTQEEGGNNHVRAHGLQIFFNQLNTFQRDQRSGTSMLR